MNKVIENAKLLGQSLKDSDEFKIYKEAQKACLEDRELTAKINEFKVQKKVLDNENEKSAEERDADILAMIKSRLDALYNEIYSYDIMKQFTKAEDDFNILMNAVNMTITSYINDASVSSESSSCTHNCSTCGGCH